MTIPKTRRRPRRFSRLVLAEEVASIGRTSAAMADDAGVPKRDRAALRLVVGQVPDVRALLDAGAVRLVGGWCRLWSRRFGKVLFAHRLRACAPRRARRLYKT